MTRYKLPDALGGGEHDGVPDGETIAFDLPDLFGTLWLHVSDVAPVDTTPDEPEPGAWLIGEKVCWHDPRWKVTGQSRWRVFGEPRWWTWDVIWADLGGPGITPRRLVPAPTAQLPVTAKSHYQNTVIVEHYDGASVSMTLPKRLTEWFDADNAEILGNAFLTAARAAREVAP